MACTPPVVNNGSLITIETPFELEVIQGGAQIGVLTTLTLPAGTIYNSHVVSAGVFNPGTLEWTVDITPPDIETLSITVEVTDVVAFTATDRTIEADVTAVLGEVNLVNNHAERCLLGFTSVELLPCQSQVVPVLTITADTIYDPTLHTVLLADASLNTIDVTIDPADLIVAGCGSYELSVKVIDISNAVTLVASSGVIVDFSNIAGAAATLPILNIGESKKIVSNGINLFVI